MTTASQRKYNETRPNVTWRMPALRRDDIKAVKKQLNLSNQKFVDRLFDLAFPTLQQEAGLPVDNDMLDQTSSELIELVEEMSAYLNSHPELLAKAKAVVDMAKTKLSR